MKKLLLLLSLFAIPAIAMSVNEQLIYAARRGDLDGIRDALHRGADIEARDDYDWNPLEAAAVTGHHDAMDLLINHGAQINSSDKNGRTPLRIAAANGNIATVKFLLAHGARIDLVDHLDRTAYDIAKNEGHTEICDLLRPSRIKGIPT